MKKTRINLLAIWVPVLLVAFLFMVGCQSGGDATPPEDTPSADVSIKDTETADTETADAAEEPEKKPMRPITGKYTRKSKRDPFVPVVGRPEPNQPNQPIAANTPQPVQTVTETIQPDNPDDTPKEVVKTVKKTPAAQEIDETQAGVRVAGIMRVGGGYAAILTSANKSYNVKTGEKIGDWTVASVTAKEVVLKAPGYIARLKLKDPNAPKVPGPGGGKKDDGPAPPPPPPQ